MRLNYGKSSENVYSNSENDYPTTAIPVPLEHIPNHTIQKTRKHFLKFFIDFNYYLCIFPYKILETADGTYVKRGFIVQQFFCCVVQCVGLLDVATYLRLTNYDEISSRPKMYFEIFITFIHAIVIIVFSNAVWKKADLLCNLLQKVQKCPIVSQWYPKRITLIMSIFMITSTILSLLTPILALRVGSHTVWTSWGVWYKFLVSRGRYMLFLGDAHEITRLQELNFTSAIAFSQVTASHLLLTDLIFAGFSYFAMTCEWIIIYQTDILMNVMALTLYTATKFFVNRLKHQENCKEVFGNYEVLKTLSQEINCIIGPITLTYTVDSILYYATNLETLFTGGHWFSNLIVIQFFLSTMIWLHFASASCLQMEQFREWIRQKENRSHLPAKSMSVMLLLDEISTNTVSLSGNGLFTVNYKFVAQALTTIMTYFIIVVQFNAK